MQDLFATIAILLSYYTFWDLLLLLLSWEGDILENQEIFLPPFSMCKKL